ncbi:16913_t:CDS:2 [Funneliformis mosseae]|uniref:16913_t:CDS:1 n=1 Tax=Funneliformis mosseae TaxID=27381 RepID=A0A9N9F502_FUNMO|nr:16913_t:CDS:2 [Funneliformis mosseae]
MTLFFVRGAAREELPVNPMESQVHTKVAAGAPHTPLLVTLSIISIIGCGIWRCHRIRRNSKAELENNKMEFGENHNHSRPSSAYASSTGIPIPSTSFPAPIYGDNYSPYNKVAPSSKSFDSMDEIIPKKKYKS